MLDIVRALFDSPGQITLILGPEQEILAASTSARWLFDLASDSASPSPGLPSEVSNAVARASDGQISRVDIQHPDPAGAIRTFELIVQPVGLGAAGTGTLLHAYDVTEHRLSERQGALLSSIALAIGETDNVNLAVAATLQRLCEATGWILGEAWIPRVVEGKDAVLERRGVWSIPDAHLEAFATQTSGFRFNVGEGPAGSAWQSGEPVRINDLRESTLFARGAPAAAAGLRAAVAIPLVCAAGEVVAVLVFFMRYVHPDTEQLVSLASTVTAPLAQLLRHKQVEEARRAAEARFAGIVSIASDAIISVGSDRRVILYNSGAERIFGYSAAEVTGQLVDMLLPENLRSRHAAHISGFEKAPETARRMGERSCIFGLRKNGEVFPAEASISRLQSADEWIYTVILRDVSDQVQAEEELRVLAERMRDAAASRDNVMALVSHDLRNPLNTISICLSALRDDPPPTAAMADGLVSLAQESVTSMSRMIQDLLDAASIDAGKLSLERTPQSLRSLLRHAVEIHQMLASEYQVELCLQDEPAEDPLIANVDGERVMQVLSNLIGNACKFTPAGGRITLAVSRHGGVAEISVRDTGSGIPSDMIPHIFDRFWHARRNAAQRSTGLGLAIARGLVEAHGGHIAVESTVNEGTTFFVTLPLVETAGQELAGTRVTI